MFKRFAYISLIAIFSSCASNSEGTSDAAMKSEQDAGSNLDNYSVEFETSTGSFIVDVTRAWSPKGADRFGELVDAGFYDECRFFRVVPGFMVQFGINGTPATQMNWTNQTIGDDSVVETNTRGFVSFAQTAEPNSRTTQIFINYSDNSFLDSMGFSPFGKIRANGMDSVDSITSEYGETPQQGQIQSSGNVYLETNFPNLDYVVSARRVAAP